jgi:enterochelin esterase-like enzyme
MNKLFYSLLVIGLSVASIVNAQPGGGRRMIDESTLPGKRAETNIRNAMYPRILPDNRVIFRVQAPDAKSVQIDLGKKYDMQRDANGAWTVTTEPQTEGFHYYFLLIDGVSLADPASESFYGCSVMSSGIEIPYPAGKVDFYRADVPQGDIHEKHYFSKTANAWRRMFVYTPPGYETSGQKYPVLYLQHGGGEDERGWSQQGRTGIILDNLIAKKQAVPMIIVMADGNSTDFNAELLNNVIPYVEKTFRVKTDKDSRALAGLSMGGIQALNIGIGNPELFSYLGIFSSGWYARPMAATGAFGGDETEKNYALLKEKKDYYNKAFKQFWLSMGGEEDIAYNNCQVMMKRFDEIGIKYTYFDTPGGHTWPVWRESLLRFAPLLFK